MVIFVWWFADPNHIGNHFLYGLLTFGLGFRLLKALHEWYHYSSVSVPKRPASHREWKVDMITTFCAGEPYEMIVNTLEAMVAVSYPHKTYLCDEADDPYLKKVCEELGVIHSYRGENKQHAKAGNVNFCLENKADGDIVIILDPDHVPTSDFIDRVIPYFENPEIGFVQCVQAYGNQEESFVAKGAAEQTYHFYGPMMMSMNTYGTVQAIGANCTFRRSALDSIGGHAAGLAEDMHTAMQLHAKGWKSLYVPELLTRGQVPSTISAYYKQQLKWSRGVFELLFRVYPKLFWKFTWRQKLHYFLIPLFFLHGLIGLIDMTVPIVSLLLAEVPWHVELITFAQMVIPLLAMNMLIRQFAQRWMLEEQERGFHVLGGILLASTWWIHLVGFVYAIFKIKVPYIPTPKDDEPENAWLLGLPNFIIIVLSGLAIYYGLSIDWTPYSMVMAFFAAVNMIILFLGILMGQQKMMIGFYNWLGMDGAITGLRGFWWNVRHFFLYRLIRNSSLLLALLMMSVLTGYSLYEKRQRYLAKELAHQEIEQVKWFYSGIKASDNDINTHLADIRAMEEYIQTSFDIVAFDQDWGDLRIPEFYTARLRDISENGVVPLVCWEPLTKEHPSSPSEKDSLYSVFKYILAGHYDEYIQRYALGLREVKDPVFLLFASQPDNPEKVWYSTHKGAAELYKQAYQYVVARFADMGVSNVVWVWNPWKAEAFENYFPGNNYVQWVGVSCLNQGEASESGWKTFHELYYPFNQALAKDYQLSKKPVMITDFGSPKGERDQAMWMESALSSLQYAYPEIRSILFMGPKTENAKFLSSERSQLVIHKHLNSSKPFIDKPPFITQADVLQAHDPIVSPLDTIDYSTQTVLKVADPRQIVNKQPTESIKGTVGKYELMVDGKPFYIKGVAYNPTHDWRDGFLPLTRSQLEKDFSRIKAMGANTVRRYGNSGIYDWNILTIAEEMELKVIYGLWFDPQIDFYIDTARVREYERETIALVKQYKDHPAILAWTLGNETWSSLKFHFQQPYLTKIRHAYVAMIEKLAAKIHEIDPGRPVMTALDHSEELSANLADYHFFAPSLDFIGVNTYYGSRIEKLDKLITQFDPGRPYLVSSFGPPKYWDPTYNGGDVNFTPVENSSYEKAQLYNRNWLQHVLPYKGNNIGGVAFCWQDRMEGTATWFGITDFKGRLKPSYYALKNAWQDEKNEPPLFEAYISGPEGKLHRGQSYTYKAVSENVKRDDLQYHWYLLREKYLDDSGDANLVDGGSEAMVRIPFDNYNYRLYLYISDKDGNVVTASEGIELVK